MVGILNAMRSIEATGTVLFALVMRYESLTEFAHLILLQLNYIVSIVRNS